ncbi:type II asparaginase [Opitutales bacterium ASA1]|nr:type II asparaginase [Opitutales bacterium ASA1]
MGRASSILALAALLAFPATAQEIPDLPPPGLKLPHVVLMSMGGTIASKGEVRLNITNYGGPNMRVEPDEWVADVPEVALVARVTTEDFRAPQAAPGAPYEPGRTYENWYKVARRLQEIAKDPTIDGVVVTHGTNSMADTAWFMNLVVSIEKPVVFVGSQRPWTAMSGDGPLNLYNAIRVAASPDAARKGVLHAMNQNVNAARDVMKMSAYRMETFRSIDSGVMGVADPDVVKFFTEPTRKHTFKSEFNIASLPETLPSVEILYTYVDAPPYVVPALVKAGVKGIVVDGMGAGGVGEYADELKKAQAAGVVVVATARTRSGRVQETPRRTESGIVPGDNLLPEKAKLLLQLALTKTTDAKQIKRFFDEY